MNQHPPIPPGFHHWEPRPHGWKSEGDVKYAFRNHRLPSAQWQVMPGTMQTFGDPECEYLQAMREPAIVEQLNAREEPAPEQEPATPATEPEGRDAKLLALLHTARHHSNRMDMVAYEAIQNAINLLTP